MSRDAALALSRFGLGARPGERADIAEDPRGWVQDQMSAPADDAEAFVDAYTMIDIGRAIRSREALQDELQDAIEAGDEAAALALREDQEAINDDLWTRSYEDRASRVRQGITTDTPVREKLIRFWTNHFTVSGAKDEVALLTGAYEREAIRPNMDGSFYDLLKAVQQSPGMLIYLDNYLSAGPNSRFGRRHGGGINENLAREIFELHTLGVDGGYTQSDVSEFALAISGWSAGFPPYAKNRPGQFKFKRNMHEPGTRTIMGVEYPQSGVDQGEAVLRTLSESPETATFIATKLVRHFVGDQPPVGAIARVADVFLETNGDLPSVHQAVFDSEEIWDTPFAKARTSEEFVIAGGRALEVEDYPYGWMPYLLKTMGHSIYGPPGPNGWPDIAPFWLSGNSVMRRAEIASQLGGYGWGIDAEERMDDMFGPLFTNQTRTAIRDAEDPAQAMAVALASFELSYL